MLNERSQTKWVHITWFHSCKILVNVNLYQLRTSVVYWSPGFGFVVGERREDWQKGYGNFGYGNTHTYACI